MIVLDTPEDWDWWLATWQFVLDAAEIDEAVHPGQHAKGMLRCLVEVDRQTGWSLFCHLVHLGLVFRGSTHGRVSYTIRPPGKNFSTRRFSCRAVIFCRRARF